MAEPREFDASDIEQPMIDTSDYPAGDLFDPDDPAPSDDWATDTWLDDQIQLQPVSEPVPNRPQRIRKRRIVSGVLFLVLGLAGVVADAFDTSANTALAISILIGALVLLGGLTASEKRRREILRFS